MKIKNIFLAALVAFLAQSSYGDTAVPEKETAPHPMLLRYVQEGVPCVLVKFDKLSTYAYAPRECDAGALSYSIGEVICTINGDSMDGCIVIWGNEASGKIVDGKFVVEYSEPIDEFLWIIPSAMLRPFHGKNNIRIAYEVPGTIVNAKGLTQITPLPAAWQKALKIVKDDQP